MKRALPLLVLLACGKSAPTTSPPAADAAPAATAQAAQAPAPRPVAGADAAVAGPAPLVARPGGPSVETCARAADHLASLVEDSALGPTPEQRAYVEHVLARDRDKTVRYCVEVAAPKEIECLLAAKDVSQIYGCDRLRRDIGDLVNHKEPTRDDCERFFDRLRGFKIEEGASPAAVDKDREQIVRSCQEKAKIGTIICFIASPTYKQARSCP